MAVAKSKKTLGKVINAASNFEISIGQTAKLIAEIMNVDIQIDKEKKRIRPKESEVNRLFGDNSLIKSLTDWEPKYSGVNGFKEGLRITSEWFINPKNLEKYKTNDYVI